MRARSDAAVALARAKVDENAARDNGPSARTLERTRDVEDEARNLEREVTSRAREAERIERKMLIDTSRELTDKDLTSERGHADAALATRDEFLAVVSHDLRNMLGAVSGFANLIAKATESGEAKPDVTLGHAQRIERTCARMSRVIGDLVDVASIDAGALAIERAPTDFARLVREALDSFELQARASRITLAANVASPLPTLSIDGARVLQVIVNLLGNALKFTRAPGDVALRVERTAEGVQLSVRDSGVGIPADKLEAIFERFVQLRRPREARAGLGLGLFIAKSIVVAHGGRIWAESSGRGSTFTFTMPVAAA